MLILVTSLVKTNKLGHYQSKMTNQTKTRGSKQTVMLIIDNILLVMLLKHMKGFYSIKKSNKILNEVQRILCSLMMIYVPERLQ